MKGSLVTSAVLHAIVLALALVTLGKPEPFEVQNVEALPVDLVPIEELTQIQQGDKKAPPKEKASPKPTKRQDKVDNAENAGENNVDLKNPPTPVQRPQQTEVAAAPKPVEEVKPQQDTTPTETKVIQKEEKAAPPEKTVPVPKPVPEPTPEPKPQETAKPEPAPEPKPQETAKAEETPLPDAVPLPTAKPVPEKPAAKQEEAKPAKPETKDTKADTKPNTSSDQKQAKEKKETAKSTSSRQTDKIADEVAALLNKEDAAGGGAKRSSSEAALGGKKTTGGTKLSQTEMDALRNVIQNNWNVIPGMMDAADIRIRVSFHLDKSGEIVGDPEVTVTGGSGSSRDVLASSAKRAVLKSAPFSNLPPDKYDAWSDVVVNFDPSDFM